MILIVGALWGFHGPAIKFAFTAGFTFPQVVLGEYVVGGLFFGVVVAFQRRAFPPWNPRSWAKLVLASVVGCGVPLFLFWSYHLGPVSIGATVFFLYVPLTQLLNLILTGRPPNRREVISMVLIVAGAAAANILGQGGLSQLKGVPYALMAAFCFACFFATTARLGRDATPAFQSMFFSVVACPILYVTSLAAGWPLVPSIAPLKGLLWILGLGLGGQVIPVFLLVRYAPRTGSGLGSILASLELPVAVTTSALLLGDPLGPTQIAGVVLVLVGIALPHVARSAPPPGMGTESASA